MQALGHRPIVHLVVGLPGAGKTTLAKQLEAEGPALRLTPDEWQILLYGDANPEHLRDLVEGKLIEIGMRAAELGSNVVLDFGFWGVDERSSLRWIAEQVGVRLQPFCWAAWCSAACFLSSSRSMSLTWPISWSSCLPLSMPGWLKTK